MISVWKTHDLGRIKAAMAQYSEHIEGFEDDWVDHRYNVALTNDAGDIGLFEWEPTLEGTVCGHYFFFSRGKSAKAVAIAMISNVFDNYDFIHRIVGLTPMDNKPALWMTRQLGLTDCGVITIHSGPHRLSQMTRQQWYNKE